jgi:hypothetical protein
MSKEGYSRAQALLMEPPTLIEVSQSSAGYHVINGLSLWQDWDIKRIMTTGKIREFIETPHVAYPLGHAAGSPGGLLP